METPVVNSEEKVTTATQPSSAAQSQATRVFVVLNPVAGQTDPAVARDTIIRFCEQRGWQCEIHETQKDEDLRQLVRDQVKKGTDMVLAAGGDGTISAVVSGMVNSKVPMGILPAGTGNALARDLLIPVDLGGALNLLDGDHVIQEMDIMEVTDAKKHDFYVMNVSVGITSIVMGETGREEKRRFGFLAYIYNAIGSIIHSDVRFYLLKADNKQIRVNATEVMITNCKFLGLQPQMDGVTIEPDDGIFNVFIVRAKSLRGYLDVFARFILRRKPDEDSNLRYLEIHNSIDIRSDRPMPVQADGEVIGKTPVSVRMVPRALRVIVPPKA